jgi:hypothetical protein
MDFSLFHLEFLKVPQSWQVFYAIGSLKEIVSFVKALVFYQVSKNGLLTGYPFN